MRLRLTMRHGALRGFRGACNTRLGKKLSAQPSGVLGYRGLYEAHRKLLRDLEEQARQAGLKHETS